MRIRKIWGGLLCLLLLRLSSSADNPGAASRQDLIWGKDLFNGTVQLRGRMSTHLSDLPTEAIRCSNCHATATGPAVPRSNAPRIGRQLLLLPQARRGGPPSRYDVASFCVLLRKGIDPAYVMVDEEMPRYTMSDAECSALWRFLTADAP